MSRGPVGRGRRCRNAGRRGAAAAIPIALLLGAPALAGGPGAAREPAEPGSAPETEIIEAPGVETFARHPAFRFRSNTPGTEFECRLDRPRWSRCRSPFRAGRLAHGRHEFRVRATLAGIADRSPALVGFRVSPRTEVIGHSVRGRAIRVRRSGDPAAERKLLVVGSIHGDETQGHRVVARLRRHYGDRIGAVDLWTITTVNPDGVAENTRKNAHGVDLNRNFDDNFDPNLSGGYESGPRPFSEPESRTVARLARRVRFELAIWYHQPWGRTLIPCNHTAGAARRYARLSGLEALQTCDGYVPGGAIGWQYHRFGTAAFVVEFPGRRLREAEVRRHASAVKELARDPG